MNMPVTIKFFREIELYQELKSLNKKFRKDTKKDTKNDWKVWNTEKAILSWYSEQTALSVERGRNDILKEVLKEEERGVKDVSKKYDIGLTVSLENLIKRGYATGDKEKITLTSEGILMGSVINSSKTLFGKIRYELFYWLAWGTIISGAIIVLISAFEKVWCFLCK